MSFVDKNGSSFPPSVLTKYSPYVELPLLSVFDMAEIVEIVMSETRCRAKPSTERKYRTMNLFIELLSATTSWTRLIYKVRTAIYAEPSTPISLISGCFVGDDPLKLPLGVYPPRA